MFLNLTHKRLKAWQKAVELLVDIYTLCEKLPQQEKYNLSSQLKRAGLSISNNIAEGCARKSKAEKNRFFEVARSSLVEVDNCMEVLMLVGYVTYDNETKKIGFLIEELFRIISGLINSNINNNEGVIK